MYHCCLCPRARARDTRMAPSGFEWHYITTSPLMIVSGDMGVFKENTVLARPKR